MFFKELRASIQQLREEQQALREEMRETRTRLLDRNLQVAEEWERRYFEQKRLYEELVFAQRKLIHEGIAAVLNKGA